jgi:predicted DNA-binding transcriptional regulator AlpA
VILRFREVCDLVKLSRSTIWRLRRDKSSGFPNPIQISTGLLGWRREEVDTWLASRAVVSISGKAA